MDLAMNQEQLIKGMPIVENEPARSARELAVDRNVIVWKAAPTGTIEFTAVGPVVDLEPTSIVVTPAEPIQDQSCQIGIELR